MAKRKQRRAKSAGCYTPTAPTPEQRDLYRVERMAEQAKLDAHRLEMAQVEAALKVVMDFIQKRGGAHTYGYLGPS